MPSAFLANELKLGFVGSEVKTSSAINDLEKLNFFSNWLLSVTTLFQENH